MIARSIRRCLGIAALAIASRPAAAKQVHAERLPVTDAALPAALSGPRGDPMRLRRNQVVRSTSGATARLVVYAADCHCDSGEPTPTRVGLYIGARGHAGVLVHARSMLIRDEDGATSVHVDATLDLAADAFALRATTLEWGPLLLGDRPAGIRRSADSLWYYADDGSLLRMGVLAPPPDDELAYWVQVPSAAATVSSRIVASAGLTLWRARKGVREMTLSPAASDWFLGPFRDTRAVNEVARALGAELQQSAPTLTQSRLAIERTEALRIDGPRPLLIIGDPQAVRARLNPMLAAWRQAMVRVDPGAFSALFSPAHFHVNSYGTRAEVGTVLVGPRAMQESQQLFTCLRNAGEMAAGLRIAGPVPSRDYRSRFAATMQHIPVSEVLSLRGLRCSPDQQGPTYEVALELGWLESRWVVLDAYLGM